MVMRWGLALVGMILSAVVCAGPALAESGEELDSLRKEIESLKAGQQAIQKELQEIKKLLQQPRQARRETVESVDIALSIAGDPVKGDPGAALTLVEFSDYQCPFCARHSQSTLPQVDREYVQTGKIRYVFRDFPIERIHPHAFKASEAANCAGEQGKYWEMHDRLFANRKALGSDQLPGYAEAIGLDMSRFRECLDSGRQAEEIRQDLADGQKAGVRGTPTFFLGVANEDGSTIKATRRIRGAVTFGEFKKAIDSMLKTGQ